MFYQTGWHIHLSPYHLVCRGIVNCILYRIVCDCPFNRSRHDKVYHKRVTDPSFLLSHTMISIKLHGIQCYLCYHFSSFYP